MTTQNTIEVVVSLTAPLHLAYPGNYSDGLSRTITQTLYVEGKKHSLPYYPANGFRGGLRRQIADMICDSVAETEGPIPGELYNGLHCGASSGSPDQTAKSIEEIIRARSHVYMGLFGGGARTHESMYAVSDMLPILDATLRAGMVPEAFRAEFCPPAYKDKDGVERQVEPFSLIGERHFVRVDDLYRVMDPEGIANTVASPIETVNQHQMAVGINKAERQAEGDVKATKEDVANIQSIQTIAAGTPMYFRVDLKSDATEAQAGAILLGILGLLEENNFGCMGRWGFGRVKLEGIYTQFGGVSREEMGVVTDVAILPEGVKALIEQAQAEIRAIRKDDIADFFKDFSVEAKKKKAKKGAAAAASADSEVE